MREQVVKAIENEKIIAIARGLKKEYCLKTAQALYDGGIRLLELPFNPKDPASFAETAEAIRMISDAFAGRMFVGAGTVISEELVQIAYDAHAEYIVSPDMNPDVIQKTRALGMVSVPGCMTPSEMTAAHRAGADFIKVFPASNLGPAYFKAIRSPLSHLKLLAVGGIDEHNIPDFSAAGAVGFGVGGNLVSLKKIEAGLFGEITETARAIQKAVDQ